MQAVSVRAASALVSCTYADIWTFGVVYGQGLAWELAESNDNGGVVVPFWMRESYSMGAVARMGRRA